MDGWMDKKEGKLTLVLKYFHKFLKQLLKDFSFSALLNRFSVNFEIELVRKL